MNEERTGKCLRQMEHIRGQLCHRYSVAVNSVMVATVKLSKWWLYPSHCRFYMPHGLTVDDKGNLWVTDVALHQVCIQYC